MRVTIIHHSREPLKQATNSPTDDQTREASTSNRETLFWMHSEASDLRSRATRLQRGRLRARRAEAAVRVAGRRRTSTRSGARSAGVVGARVDGARALRLRGWGRARLLVRPLDRTGGLRHGLRTGTSVRMSCGGVRVGRLLRRWGRRSGGPVLGSAGAKRGAGERAALVGELLRAGARVGALEEAALVAEDLARVQARAAPGGCVRGAAVEAPATDAVAQLGRRVVGVDGCEGLAARVRVLDVVRVGQGVGRRELGGHDVSRSRVHGHGGRLLSVGAVVLGGRVLVQVALVGVVSWRRRRRVRVGDMVHVRVVLGRGRRLRRRVL